MSILIKGMEMPEHCGYCRFRYDGICHALQKTQYSMEECPLVPVPTPHGDLIDRNKLYEKTANWEAQALDQTLRYRPEEDRDEWRRWSAVLKERSAFKFDIADAPTVIEADELVET